MGNLIINRAHTKGGQGTGLQRRHGPRVVHWSSIVVVVVGCVGAFACSPTKQNVQIPMFLVAQLRELAEEGLMHQLPMDAP